MIFNYVRGALAAITLPGVLFILVFPSTCSKLRDVSPNDSSCLASACHLSTILKKYPPDSGKHTPHLAKEGITCNRCHYKYIDNVLHKNGILDADGNHLIVSFDNNTTAWNNSDGTCTNIQCHNTLISGKSSGNSSTNPASISWYGTVPDNSSTVCLICHTGGDIDPLAINGSGSEGKHVIHFSQQGLACTKCHNNYKNSTTHFNGILDTENPSIIISLFDSTNPAGQWINDTGTGTGSCSLLDCHGAATLDWYGPDDQGWTLPDCTVSCHNGAMNNRRQVTGAGGDFERESHHVINYAARTTEVVQQSDCIVCHDMGNHMSGRIILRDKDNSSTIEFDPADLSSAEAFCLSCHDTDGALAETGNEFSPFSSGNTLGVIPNRAGTEIKSSWEKTYGHGKEGLTCLGDGTNGTGCHGYYNSGDGTGTVNAHGSGNRGLLSNRMNLPVDSAAWNRDNYKLCLDCHDAVPAAAGSAEIFGMAVGGNYAQELMTSYNYFPYSLDFMVTSFHEFYAYTLSPPHQLNLHLFHISWYPLKTWYYRGDPAVDGSDSSYPSCPSCHNVHGVNGEYAYLYDEWQFSTTVLSGVEYGEMLSPNFDDNIYPQFCYIACHGAPPNRYPRGQFNEAKAVASIGSGNLGSNDTVTISFSESTNGPATITPANIDSILALNNGHLWGTIKSAVWNSPNNDSLTITLSGDTGIAVGDTITFDESTIADITDGFNPIYGTVIIKGN